MALETQDIRARSATTVESAPNARSFRPEVAKLIDLSRCIGCKACQAACMEWNDLREEVGTFQGSYTNPLNLTDQSWTVMKFNELEVDGSLAWFIFKDGCLHCADPGCLKACPAPGAVVQYANGIVDFQQDSCIGCGYCITGCPFDIPRIRKEDGRVYKCTLCSDRVSVGLEPACIKSCPTQALTFGSMSEMKELAAHRLVDLRERGLSKAAIYDPVGVGGTHVFFVLPHGDRPETYGLPRDPSVGPVVTFWRSGVARALGVATMFGVLVAGVLHYMRYGPLEVPDEADGKSGKEAQP
jgi:formate dehydrogenase iron-sulfur subunit